MNWLLTFIKTGYEKAACSNNYGKRIWVDLRAGIFLVNWLLVTCCRLPVTGYR